MRAKSYRIAFILATICCIAATFCAPTSVVSAPTPQFFDPPSPPTPPLPPRPLVPPSAPQRPFSPIEKKYLKQMEEEIKRRQEWEARQEKVKETESELEKLLEEFGPNARLYVSDYYVCIYDTTDGYAAWCSTIFGNVANAYVGFRNKFKFGWKPLEEPMVVLIFARKEDYEAYVKRATGSEFVNAKNKPAGCYFPGANRCVFYDLTEIERNKIHDDPQKTTRDKIFEEILSRPNAEENATIVAHEATHQISYNLGLFDRNGENPSWAIEGLAMLFEPPCGAPKDGGWKPTKDFPINARRLQEFQEYASTNPEEKPVRKCVSLEYIRADEPCAYPLSWAIFYYLYKKEPKKLAYYLYFNQLAQPRMVFTEAQRVAEFEYFFGDDWDGMYLQLRVFAESLSLQLEGVEEEEADARARKKFGVPDPEPIPKDTKAKNQNANREKKDVKRDSNSDLKTESSEKANAKKKDEKTRNAKKDEPKAQNAPKSTPRGKNDLATRPRDDDRDKPATPAKRDASTKKKNEKEEEDDDWLDAWDKPPKNRK